MILKNSLKLNNINNVKIINGVFQINQIKRFFFSSEFKHGYFMYLKILCLTNNKYPKKINLKSYTIDELIIKYKKHINRIN